MLPPLFLLLYDDPTRAPVKICEEDGEEYGELFPDEDADDEDEGT
jgi:hypothetical protein